MAKITTTRYDVAEHLRTPEEMAAYLEACLAEANGDAAFYRQGTREYRKG
jgi:DNA-binding phage protein